MSNPITTIPQLNSASFSQLTSTFLYPIEYLTNRSPLIRMFQNINAVGEFIPQSMPNPLLTHKYSEAAGQAVSYGVPNDPTVKGIARNTAALSFIFHEEEEAIVREHPSGDTLPIYDGTKVKYREVVGGVYEIKKRIATSGLVIAKNFNQKVMNALSSAQRHIEKKLLEAIYAPIYEVEDGKSSIKTLADDANATKDLSSAGISFDKLLGAMDELTINTKYGAMNKSEYFLILPAKVWAVIYTTLLKSFNASTIIENNFSGTLQLGKNGYNVIVLPDDKVKVENGKYLCPLITQRSLAMELKKPPFSVPRGFTDLMVSGTMASDTMAAIVERQEMPFLLYSSDSEEMLHNDASMTLAWTAIAGRVSSKNVFTLQFATSPTASK